MASQNLPTSVPARTKSSDGTGKQASNGQAVSKRLGSDLMTLMVNSTSGTHAFSELQYFVVKLKLGFILTFL